MNMMRERQLSMKSSSAMSALSQHNRKFEAIELEVRQIEQNVGTGERDEVARQKARVAQLNGTLEKLQYELDGVITQ